jgi:hypothetical protein
LDLLQFFSRSQQMAFFKGKRHLTMVTAVYIESENVIVSTDFRTAYHADMRNDYPSRNHIWRNLKVNISIPAIPLLSK